MCWWPPAWPRTREMKQPFPAVASSRQALALGVPTRSWAPVPLTTRPSPLPTSTRDPRLRRSIFTTFSICLAVAGTKGKQTLRRAGVRNGVATAYRATSAPPATPVSRSPQLVRWEPPASDLAGRSGAGCLDPPYPSRGAPARGQRKQEGHKLSRDQDAAQLTNRLLSRSDCSGLRQS